MMWTSDSDREEPVSTRTTTTTSSSLYSSSSLQPETPPPLAAGGTVPGGAATTAPRTTQERCPLRRRRRRRTRGEERSGRRRGRGGARPVVLAGEEGSPDGSGAGAGEGGVGRARSLTDDDLEELKGCVDLGFGFSYHEIPELLRHAPALELCYSMSQRFQDEHQSPPKEESAEDAPAVVPASPSQPMANWKISSPGDSPDEVKARLKYWAQAVACTVRLCS